MNKALYEEYAKLELQKNAIEDEQATLKAEILAEMKVELPEGKNGVETTYGSFTLQSKTIYAFSNQTTSLEKQLKDRKAEEIAKDIAKPKSVTEYVVFRPIKIV